MSLKAGVGFRGGSTQPTRSAIALSRSEFDRTVSLTIAAI